MLVFCFHAVAGVSTQSNVQAISNPKSVAEPTATQSTGPAAETQGKSIVTIFESLCLSVSVRTTFQRLCVCDLFLLFSRWERWLIFLEQWRCKSKVYEFYRSRYEKLLDLHHLKRDVALKLCLLYKIAISQAAIHSVRVDKPPFWLKGPFPGLAIKRPCQSRHPVIRQSGTGSWKKAD